MLKGNIAKFLDELLFGEINPQDPGILYDSIKFSKCSTTGALSAISKLSKTSQEFFSVEPHFKIVTPGFTLEYRVIFRVI